MMKKLALLLTLVLVLPLLVLPSSAAETLTDLTKVYNNLSTYLYTPYVEKSECYEAYSQKMEEIKELLKSDSITQEEISKYYNELRAAYSAMMRDVYDYSSFDPILQSFEKLNSTPFTEESWKKLVSVYDSMQRELASPTLFAKKKTTTEEDYGEHMKKHIASFSTSYSAAFSALEFAEVPESITKDYLVSYTEYVRQSSDNLLFSVSDLWEDHLDAIEAAEALCAQANPRIARMNQAHAALAESYKKIAAEVYQKNPAADALLKYEDLLKTDYSAASWERYEKQIHSLKERYEEDHFVFVPSGSDQKKAEEFISAYFNSLSDPAETARQNLVSNELYQSLKLLCSKARAAEVSEGLEIKYNLLQDAAAQGEEVLKNKNALTAEFDASIEAIENALENFSLAEDHLRQEQAKIIKQDKAASKWIVIFSVFAFFASVVCAVFLSRHHFGRIDWTK